MFSATTPVHDTPLINYSLPEIFINELEEDYRRNGLANFGKETVYLCNRIRGEIFHRTQKIYSGRDFFILSDLVRDSIGIVDLNFSKIRGAQNRQIFGFDVDFKRNCYEMICARLEDVLKEEDLII